MADYVLDASVALAWVLRSQATAATDALLSRAASLRFAAPRHLALEVRAGLLKAERVRRFAQADSAAFLATLDSIDLVFDEHSADERIENALHIARAHKLSIYDALYLDVALRRRAPLASRDERLLAAAREAGLDVYDALGAPA